RRSRRQDRQPRTGEALSRQQILPADMSDDHAIRPIPMMGCPSAARTGRRNAMRSLQKRPRTGTAPGASGEGGADEDRGCWFRRSLPGVIMRRFTLATAAVAVVCAGVAGGADAPLLGDSFSSGLVTNEYAYWNPGSGVDSPRWELTSGTLFSRGGRGWTGIPDAGCDPNVGSSNCTDSAVFRLTSKRYDFCDVTVSFGLIN